MPKNGSFGSCLRAYLTAEPNAVDHVPLDDLKEFVTDKENRPQYEAELVAAGYVIEVPA